MTSVLQKGSHKSSATFQRGFWAGLFLFLCSGEVLQAFLDTGLPRGNRHEWDS